jgi:hypothetical protein
MDPEVNAEIQRRIKMALGDKEFQLIALSVQLEDQAQHLALKDMELNELRPKPAQNEGSVR